MSIGSPSSRTGKVCNASEARGSAKTDGLLIVADSSGRRLANMDPVPPRVWAKPCAELHDPGFWHSLGKGRLVASMSAVLGIASAGLKAGVHWVATRLSNLRPYRDMVRSLLQRRPTAYLLAVLGVVAVTIICFPLFLREHVSKTTVALAMLLVVQFVAILGGRWPALLASTLAALAYDYFFLPPIYTFIIESAQDWIALGTFFITAVSVGELFALARRRALEAEAARNVAQLRSAYNRGLIEASLDPLVAIGHDGKITDLNAATEAITGKPRSKIIGTDFSEYFTVPAQARFGYEQAFRNGFVRDYPLEIKRKEGEPIPVVCNASVYRDEIGNVAGVFAEAREVSGVKQAEREIRRFASFPHLAPVPIIEFDRAMQVRFMNPSMEKMLNRYNITDPRMLVPSRLVSKLSEKNGPDAEETEEIEIAGRTFDERFFFTREFQTLRLWALDITDSKQTERALRRLNRTLQTLSAANQTLVHATDEADLLREMCRTLIQVGGYQMAWIGFGENDENKSVRIAAIAGLDEGYTQAAQISWADNERGRGPTGTAIRSGEPQINRDFAADRRMGPWRDAALKRGYASSVALPLKNAADVRGALTIYAAEPDAFDADEMKLLMQLASDLAYGIAAMRTGAEREAAVRRWYESLEDTVGAIASTIELRDPYTAGHQRRVAKLAARIAQEIGLPEDQIRGIVLAGLIHDVGKINVPAEILSKPGKLSPLEMQFIQTHPQAGYNIIKGVEFPWPIAEAILQHHERLDGSGYPRGLVSDAILLDARILAVADVTEAITAHRPYRPALGLDTALSELEGGRGRLYDAKAVDACIDLFRNKGFAFG